MEYLTQTINTPRQVAIQRLQINYNITNKIRTKEDIKFLVIHDTANLASGANAMMHYKYFNSGNKDASADFFVDSKEIVRINDYYKHYTWAIGDNYYGYRHPYARNNNSISIEICVNKDGNLNETLLNTIVLVKELKKWMPHIQILRHYDCTHKPCPGNCGLWDNSPNVAQGWINFKQQCEF